MRKTIAVLLIAVMAIIGMAGADDYEGIDKGPDDPLADVIGANQTMPILDLSGAKSMDIGNQAFGRTGIPVLALSGYDPAVFGNTSFKKDGVGTGGSTGAWKPGI